MLGEVAKLFLGCDWQFGLDERHDEPMLIANRGFKNHVVNYGVEVATLVEPLRGMEDKLAIAHLYRAEAGDLVVVESDERVVNGDAEFRAFCDEFYQYLVRKYSADPVCSCGRVRQCSWN